MSNFLNYRNPEIRFTKCFETSKCKTEEELIHTSDLNILKGISYALSTFTEIESSTLHSQEECIKRMLDIENKAKSGYSFKDPHFETLYPMLSRLSLSDEQQHTSAKTAHSDFFVEQKEMETAHYVASNSLVPIIEGSAVNFELSSSFPELSQEMISNIRITLGFEMPKFKHAVERCNERIRSPLPSPSPLPKRRIVYNIQGMPIPQLVGNKSKVIPTSPKSYSTVYEMFVKSQQMEVHRQLEIQEYFDSVSIESSKLMNVQSEQQNQENSAPDSIESSEMMEVEYDNHNHYKNDRKGFGLKSGESKFYFTWFKSRK